MRPEDIQVLQIEPTSHCNAKCPHCPRFDFIEPDATESTGTLHPDLKLSHIDVDLITENLQGDRLTSLKTVLIEGDKGDPLMCPDIEKLVEFFSNLSSLPSIFVVTNGSIRNPQWWSELGKKQYRNLTVVFSIDGLEDTNHLYRVGLEWDRIISNAQAFIDVGGRAVWKMLVFKHNQDQINEARRRSEAMGFSEFCVNTAFHYRFKDNAPWPVRTKQGVHYIELADKPVQFGETLFKNPIKEKLPTVDSSKICPNLARGHIYITHENYVIPCCMMHFLPEQNYFGKDDFLKLAGDLDQHDLTKNTIDKILQNRFFGSELINSFGTDKMHYICTNSCGKQIEHNIKLTRKSP